MGQIENNICDAINILVNKAISDVKLDKTVLATIEECVDEGAQKYRVKYQDSSFYAYSIGDQKYSKRKQVYVLIPSNDTTENRLILGTVDKLGGGYIKAVSMENRMTKIGCNLFNREQQDSFCSYKSDTKVITDFGVNTTDLEQKCYQDEAEYFMIAANFQTMIPEEQRYGQGDYGIIVTCEYYNDNNKQRYTKDYILHVSNMLEQPYQYSVPTRQYAIFQLENQLIDIPQVTLFTRNFPISNPDKENDIFISDYEFYYLKALSEDEIAGAALKIEATKTGTIFKKDATPTTELHLKAKLKLNGSLMQETKGLVEYYWFVRDLTITSDNEDKKGYYYLGGNYWRCLNPEMATEVIKNNTTTDSEESQDFINYAPDSDEKILIPADCPCSSLTFKCVAVMDDFILQDTIMIYNENANYNIILTSKYGERFSFNNYISMITAQVIDNTTQQDITLDCKYVWGFEADNGIFHELTEEKTNKLQHYPSGSHVKYIVTVSSKTGLNLGTAEIYLINEQQQQNYTLNLINGNQVFKYSTLGVSPAYEGTKNQKRQAVLPLSFELYDKEGYLVGIREDETGQIIDDRYNDQTGEHLFDIVWYFPVDNTMLIPQIKESLSVFEKVFYNGIEYYKIPVKKQEQLNFQFKIKNKYNKQYINNDIILEVKYMGYTCTTSTNFTFTKDGEIGTNGTEYIARIVPKAEVEQIYVRVDGNNTNNRKIKSWRYNNDSSIQFNEYNTSGFTLELWNGDAQPVGSYDGNSKNSNWDIYPNLKDIPPIISYNTQTQGGQTYNIGQIKIRTTSEGAPSFEPKNYRSILLQASRSDSSLSKFASSFYDNYAIPVMKITNNNTEYIVTGGFNEALYNSDGKVSNYSTTSFKLLRYIKNNKGEYIKTDFNETQDEITWQPSWEKDIIYTGVTPRRMIGDREVEIKPPQTLEGEKNNYILITINMTDVIIWSENFYFDRYSMDLVNGWDGHAVEIGEDYMLTPQIGAGVKENDNTLTGIVIGKTYETTNNTKKDIGLFGYQKGIRTIFLNAQDGSATFGVKDGEHGCLQITPSANSNKVTINTYGAQHPNWDSEARELSDGFGGELVFNSFKQKNNTTGEIKTIATGHFFLGNNFYIDDNGNVYIQGTINAKKGKIGAWEISNSNGDIVGSKTIQNQDGTTTTNKITLDLSSSYAPAIRGSGGGGSWNIKGDGTFSLANDGLTYQKVNDVNTLTVKGNLEGDEWYIYQNGDFKFGGIDSKIEFNPDDDTMTIEADLEGEDWWIYRNGDVKLAGGNFICDSRGNLKINANSGSMKLENVDLTYNKIPLQGINRPLYSQDSWYDEYEKDKKQLVPYVDFNGSGSEPQNTSCREYPGFAIISAQISSNYYGRDSNYNKKNATVTSLAVGGFPKTSHSEAIPGYNENGKLKYTGYISAGSTIMTITRIDGNSIDWMETAYMSGVYATSGWN